MKNLEKKYARFLLGNLVGVILIGVPTLLTMYYLEHQNVSAWIKSSFGLLGGGAILYFLQVQRKKYISGG